MKKRILILTLFIFGIFNSICVFAQEGKNEDILKSSLTDFVIVASAGFGGAVLGLSTLPFTEEPSEHYRNILVGGSLGVIIGVSLVAWSQATKGRKKYNDVSSTSIDQFKFFGTDERNSWHKEQSKQNLPNGQNGLNQVSYTITF